jgi:putative SOS response-associated peptidase YedK
LIPADGFYDWKRMVTSKQPYCFEVNNGDLFAFAGWWDGWKDSRGRWVTTCTILTTMPNALTSTIHDRTPVILSPHNYDVWRDPRITDLQVKSELLKPCDPSLMRCYAVSTRINSTANDEEECARPVEIAKDQSPLLV